MTPECEVSRTQMEALTDEALAVGAETHMIRDGGRGGRWFALVARLGGGQLIKSAAVEIFSPFHP